MSEDARHLKRRRVEPERKRRPTGPALRAMRLGPVFLRVNAFLGDPSRPFEKATLIRGSPDGSRINGDEQRALVAVCEAGVTLEAVRENQDALEGVDVPLQMMKRARCDEALRLLLQAKFDEFPFSTEQAEVFRGIMAGTETGKGPFPSEEEAQICAGEAARLGNAAVFAAACAQGASPCKREVLEIAVAGGSLPIVKTVVEALRESQLGWQRCSGGSYIMEVAARWGHLDVLRFLESEVVAPDGEMFPWGKWVLVAAARGGHLGVIRFLRSEEAAGPGGERCPWDGDALRVAAENGHMEVVRWLRSDEAAGVDGKKCPWNSDVLRTAVARGDLEMVKWLRSEEAAGADGERCPWDIDVLETAARWGRLEMVKWLRSADAAGPDGGKCPWGSDVLVAAAWNGQLEVVKWLRSEEAADAVGEKCPWNSTVLRVAAKKGNLEMVQFMRSEEAAGPDGVRCPCDEWIVAEVAEEGHTEVARWLESSLQ